MPKINLIKNESLTHTLIDNIFIDKFMPDANGTFVKVYLYLLRHKYSVEGLSIDLISSSLDILESDIIKALKYWDKKRVLDYKEFTLDDSIQIEILPLTETNTNTPSIQSKNESLKSVKLSSKPMYLEEEIAIYKTKSTEIKDLFEFAEAQFCRPLKFEELNILLSIYDWLKLPFDVIYLLIQYCASSKKNLKYAEKVAINWCENNILTKEQALQKLTAYDTSYGPIMKFMGLPTLAENQKSLINKWTSTYSFGINIIKKACEYSVNAKGTNVSFNYIDTILTEWYKNNLKTLEQIQTYREEKNKKYKEKISNSSAKTNNYVPSQKKNKFLNFPQTKYNFDEIEQLEMKRTIEKLKKAGIINESANNS